MDHNVVQKGTAGTDNHKLSSERDESQCNGPVKIGGGDGGASHRVINGMGAINEVVPGEREDFAQEGTSLIHRTMI